jgi:hypothetical protein
LQTVDAPQLTVIDEASDTWPVDATRVFKRCKDAWTEAINLNLWLKQYSENIAQERKGMGKQWPHESVQESGALLPDGLYTVKVTEGEEGETKNGKYMIMFRARVVEPRQYKNQPYRIAFIVGTDDDLEADEESTWTSSFAASRYKSFLKAADVPETGDIEEEIESAEGTSVVVDNGHSDDNKYNNPNAFFRVGEREEDAPPTRSKPAKAAATKPAKGKPTRKPAPEPEEEADEADDDGEWED